MEKEEEQVSFPSPGRKCGDKATSVSQISGEGKCSLAEYKNHALSNFIKKLRTFVRHRKSNIHQNIFLTKDVDEWSIGQVFNMILCFCFLF